MGRWRLCRQTDRLGRLLWRLGTQIVKRSDAAFGFEVLPRRWVVERTFGWLMKFRRLSKDYEETVKSSEAWILLAMINIMSRRLATST